MEILDKTQQVIDMLEADIMHPDYEKSQKLRGFLWGFTNAFLRISAIFHWLDMYANENSRWRLRCCFLKGKM